MDKIINIETEGNRLNNSHHHHHNHNLEMLESHVKANVMSHPQMVGGSSSSLKDLCVLLLSSFCGILDEFGLETRADEEMLLLAMESGDFDSVIEYVKLFKNKMSSILLLNNIGRDSRTEMEIGMAMAPEIIRGIGDLKESEANHFAGGGGEVKRSGSDNVVVTGNHIKQESIVDDDFRTHFDVNNSESRNLKIPSPNQSSNLKKSSIQLPPLNIEKAGPGSWNRGQLPNEYPTEK